ncbi:MFS transporter [Salinigranum marinum]|uniref:MFS transporter n=1 Tax=Salinigranum marinum TaxID=1515595 RepID=UPI002989D477|nr:MFS transporter [Salinigranum marinum]
MDSLTDRLTLARARQLLGTFDVLVFMSLLWLLVQYLRFVFPPLFETIQTEYGVSNADVGIMYSALLFAYAIMQFPSGYLSDRFSERGVLTAGAVVFAVGSLFVFLSAPFWSLLVGVGLIGLGTGTHKTVAINMLSRLYPSRTGLSVGVMDTVGQAGGALAPVTVVAVLAVAVDWRAIFLVGAVAIVASAYGFHHSAPGPSEQSETDAAEAADETHGADGTDGTDEPGGTDDTASGRAYLQLFRYYHFSAFVAVSSTFTFAWVGLTSFYPLYLSNVASFSAGTAGALYSFLFVLSVSQPLAGSLSDRFDATTIVLLTFCCIVVGLVGVLFSRTLLAFGATTVLLGLGFHGFRPVRGAYLMQIIPAAVGGGVLGLVRTVMIVLSSLAPTLLGFTADAFGLAAAFGVLVAVSSVGLVLVLSLKLVPMPPEDEIV